MQAIAGMAGVIYQPRDSYDYGVDGQFHPVIMRGNRRITSGHPLDFQAKSTVNWDLVDDKIVFDLEAKTYNDIVSRTPSETTLILILLCLPKEQSGWHAASSGETVLRHCCYWHFLTGEVTENDFRMICRSAGGSDVRFLPAGGTVKCKSGVGPHY